MGAKTQHHQDSYVRWGTHEKEDNDNFRDFPRSKRSEPPAGLPGVGILHWEDKSPDCLTLKASGLEYKKAVGLGGSRSLP